MDAVERLLRARGVEIVDGGAAADLHLVNTCTVTAVADDKSRKAVRRARRTSPGAVVIVTGCSVQVGGATLAAVDPAARLVANEEKDGLLAEVERLLGAAAAAGDGPHGPLDGALPTLAGVEIEGIAEGRARIDRTRAFVKVQDGCSFYCTYCIIPRARGPERSLPPEVVLTDVRRALAAGHREIVLTGINIGTYDGGRSERGPRGAHLRAALTLPGLVRRILAETPVERIRLSSIEPQHVDDDLLAAWTEEGAGRCLPHLHVPLQSGDDGVLRRMGRRYLSAEYARVVERVRTVIPGLAVHADVIAGFPAEDEAAFERSLAFIRSLDPAGLHVFRYSVRPGTPAARMAGQVRDGVRKERAAMLLAEGASARRRFAERAVGGRRAVLFEEPADRRDPGAGWIGYAEDYVVVRAAPPGGRPLAGEIAVVRVEGTDPADPERAVGRIEGVVAAPDLCRGLPVVPLPA
jgi:threonylcarbamoyladenosine tRNA methylthiotransferase MtaB